MSEELKNILVVKLSAIGDVIHALPVSYAIKETFPNAKLTWVVEPPAYDLLKINPYIDEIIIFRKKEFKTLKGLVRNFFPFRKQIQAENYDAVLDLQGLFKSAAIAFFAQSNIKLGICNMRELSDKISKPVIGEHSKGHIVERYLDTARAIGCRVDKVVFPIEIPPEESLKAIEIMLQNNLDETKPYFVFAVGANWTNKRWRTDYFAQLGDWLYSLNVTPVIIGGGSLDEQRAEEIISQMQTPPINLVGKTNLIQLAYVIKKARLVIGGDTGPVHLAAGMGVRTLMLMGPTDANRNGPYGQIENAVEVDRDCKGCWKRACRKNEDCLEKISVQMIQEKILAMN